MGVTVRSNANRNPVTAIASIFSNCGVMRGVVKEFSSFGEWEFGSFFNMSPVPWFELGVRGCVRVCVRAGSCGHMPLVHSGC